MMHKIQAAVSGLVNVAFYSPEWPFGAIHIQPLSRFLMRLPWALLLLIIYASFTNMFAVPMGLGEA